jgi:hypothetical protein
MTCWASGLGMGVGRVLRLRRGVGVIAMPKTGQDTMRCIVVTPGAGVLGMLVTGVPGRVLIDRRRVADRVEVTH